MPYSLTAVVADIDKFQRLLDLADKSALLALIKQLGHKQDNDTEAAIFMIARNADRFDMLREAIVDKGGIEGWSALLSVLSAPDTAQETAGHVLMTSVAGVFALHRHMPTSPALSAPFNRMMQQPNAQGTTPNALLRAHMQ